MTSSAELQREAEKARSDLSVLLGDLKETMTRTALTSGATALAREGSAMVARLAIQRASDNPLAALLIGAGVVMLVTGRSGRSSGETVSSVGQIVDRTNAAMRETAGRAAGVASRASEAAGEMAGRVSDKVSESVREAREEISASVNANGEEVAGRLRAARASLDRGREQVNQTIGRVKERAGSLTDGVLQFTQEHPILAAAVAVAAGAILSAALPASEAEARFLGPAARRATEKSRDVADRVVGAVGEKAAEVADAATEAVAQEVLGGRKQSPIPSAKST